MKTAIKILLIVFLSLLVLALIVGGAFFLGRQFGRNLSGAAGQLGLDGETDIKLTDITEDFGSSAKSLDIQVAAGSFKVVKGDRFRVEGKNVNAESFRCELQGDTLVVREGWENPWENGFAALFQQIGYSPEISITVPEGTHFHNVDLDVYAGELRLCDLDTDSFSLDMAAGALYAGQVQAKELKIELSAGGAEFAAIQADTAQVDVSAGGISFDAMDVRDLELETSAGNLTVRGLRFQDLSASCSAGTISLFLLEKESNCRMDMDIAAGSVQVGNRSYTAKTVLGAQDAPCQMELDVSAGQIQLSFQ